MEGFGQFQSPTGSMSSPGQGDWATTLGGLVSAVGPLLGKILPPAQRGLPTQSFLPAVGAGIGARILPTIARSVLPTVAGAVAGSMFGGGDGGELFLPAGEARPRPARHVAVRGPDDRLYWFGYLGKPVLWSGDLSAARRVQRTARRATSSRGGRRGRGRFRR